MATVTSNGIRDGENMTLFIAQFVRGWQRKNPDRPSPTKAGWVSKLTGLSLTAARSAFVCAEPHRGAGAVNPDEARLRRKQTPVSQ